MFMHHSFVNPTFITFSALGPNNSVNRTEYGRLNLR